MIKVIREMIARETKTCAIKERAVDEHMTYMKEQMKKTVWYSENCGAWYQNTAGSITGLWPKNSTFFWKQTRNVDFSKLNFE